MSKTPRSFKNIFLTAFFGLLCATFSSPTLAAGAATLSLVPEGSSFGVGVEFSVDLKLNTGGVGINATEATIHFPSGMLELVSTDKKDSVFAFWLEEPMISNTEGTMHFTGGTSKGVSGEALQIIRMKFRTKGIGSAAITISDAVVTASDGKGTNTLEAVQGAMLTISPQTLTPASPAPAPAPVPAPAPAPAPEQPVRVVREPVAAKDLPKKPELRVPFYPDQSRWYNSVGEVIVFWDLPADVTQVSTLVSRNAHAEVGVREPELFSGKSLGVLGEGIWYIRVQFKNNVGWGEAAYYKVSLDWTPPAPFEASIDAEVSDNPSPRIHFETNDSLSGISEYIVFVDDREPIRTTEHEIKLLPLPPGKHTALARALDGAENSVEDAIQFEVLPLPTPRVLFISETTREGEAVFATGRSITNGFVDVRVETAAIQSDGTIKRGVEVFSGEVTSDVSGRWDLSVNESLPVGEYVLSITARDERGALSYTADPVLFRITPKPVITVGFVDLGWPEIFLIGVLFLLAFGGVVGWQHVRRQSLRGAYRVIAARDIDKFSVMLEKDMGELEQRVSGVRGSLPGSAQVEADHLVERLKDTVARMRKYLVSEVEKLK
jgi:hypothetical protein